jgi:two-component system, OmpR family, sensor histidine kinase KdpD
VSDFVGVGWRRLARAVAAQVVALVVATSAVVFLERVLGLRQASSVYLLAVATVAIGFGSVAAAGTAFGAFLTYNFLFVQPLYTFAVGEPSGILNLLLLLVVGILIGRLTGLQRDRADEALRREREARAMFAVTRSLASARRAREALPTIIERLAPGTEMSRLWIGLGPTITQEQVAADSGTGSLPEPGQPFVLRRTPDERRPEWVRISEPGRSAVRYASEQLYRVAIGADANEMGSIWALRAVPARAPTPEETRLLAATADSVGQSILRDRLALQATEREIAQRSDELKTALLDSVSHDLRTPLATIRAAAGSLADAEIAMSAEDRERTARQIDTEAERLNRIVGNLLDMSRIQAGALRPQLEMLPTEEVLRAVVDRSGPSLVAHRVQVEIDPELPPLLADPIMLDEVVVNLLENVARYTPAGTEVRVTATRESGRLVIQVEDAGPGLPPEALRKVFEKFYRHPSSQSRSGRGTGLGLAVVSGMVEAMDGTVTAHRSQLGGLAVRIELPAGSPGPAGELGALGEPKTER